MKLVFLLCGLLALNIASAEQPYTFFDEKNAQAFEGKAVIRTEKGWMYVGDMKDGKPHGNGVKISDNGVVLYGQWVNGDLEGNGATYTPAPFSALEAGKYKRNKVVGEGVIVMGEEVYQGPYGSLGLPDGEGLCTKNAVERPCTYSNGEKIQ